MTMKKVNADFRNISNFEKQMHVFYFEFPTGYSAQLAMIDILLDIEYDIQKEDLCGVRLDKR